MCIIPWTTAADPKTSCFQHTAQLLLYVCGIKWAFPSFRPLRYTADILVLRRNEAWNLRRKLNVQPCGSRSNKVQTGYDLRFRVCWNNVKEHWRNGPLYHYHFCNIFFICFLRFSSFSQAAFEFGQIPWSSCMHQTCFRGTRVHFFGTQGTDNIGRKSGWKLILMLFPTHFIRVSSKAAPGFC